MLALDGCSAQPGAAPQLSGTDRPMPVIVGPGLVDASVRQVIRTASGRVYIFAADDTAQKLGSGPGVIRAWRGNRVGIPTRFAEVDGAHRPTAVGREHVLASPDVRLGRNGIVHVLYVNETDSSLVYRRFSTATNRWGAKRLLASGVAVSTHPFKRAGTASALVLDVHGTVQIVYARGSSLFYRRKGARGWTTPARVATGTEPIHPQLAADRDGNLHLAWLDEGGPSIGYTKKPAGKRWRPAQTVATDAAEPDGVLANDTLDQGPSIVVNALGRPYVCYLNASDEVRIKFRSATRWVPNSPPALFAHTPQIYGRRNDIYVFLGHDSEIRFGYTYRLWGQRWASYRPLTATSLGTLDGSASVRWDPLHETNRKVIDTAFFDEDRNDDQRWLPRLYYMAVRPS